MHCVQYQVASSVLVYHRPGSDPTAHASPGVPGVCSPLYTCTASRHCIHSWCVRCVRCCCIHVRTPGIVLHRALHSVRLGLGYCTTLVAHPWIAAPQAIHVSVVASPACASRTRPCTRHGLRFGTCVPSSCSVRPPVLQRNASVLRQLPYTLRYITPPLPPAIGGVLHIALRLWVLVYQCMGCIGLGAVHTLGYFGTYLILPYPSTGGSWRQYIQIAVRAW